MIADELLLSCRSANRLLSFTPLLVFFDFSTFFGGVRMERNGY